MDMVIRKAFFLQSYLGNRSRVKALSSGSCYLFSSKSLQSIISDLSKCDGKKDLRLKKLETFELQPKQSLIQKDTNIKGQTEIQIKDYSLLRSQRVGEQFTICNPFQEFINETKQKNFDFSSVKFVELLENVSQDLQNLTTDKLIDLINCVSSFPEEPSCLFKFYNDLDKECAAQSPNWSKSGRFEVACALNQIKSHLWTYHKQVCIEFQDEITQMNEQSLIKFLAIVKRFRKFPPKVNLPQLEIRLFQILEHLTIEEIGIACLAFFECNQAIRNVDLVGKISERLMFSPHTTDDKTVGSILKTIRKSSTDAGHYPRQVLELQPNLYNRIDQWGLKVLMQLVSVNSNLLYFHLPTVERTIEKFLNRLSEARLKDVERVAMAMAIGCHSSSNGNTFWKLLEEEFTKDFRYPEICKYPHSFVSLVNYAVIANVYPEKLFRIALSQDFVENSKKFAQRNVYYQSTKRELLSIHCSLKLERPNYDGPMLSEEDVEEFEKIYRKPLPAIGGERLSKYDSFLLALLETVREIVGESNSASLVYLQPHFVTPDIVLSSVTHSNSVGRDRRQIVIVGGSRNMYSQFAKESMGPLRMKVRQLQAMGYVVVMVPWHEFLPRSANDRLRLLRKKLRI